MSHTIELKKVSKFYADEEAVSMGFSRIDLDLDIGEFVVITGESGSGKSTLLNVISGLDSYEEGEMFVCGEDTTAYNIEDYENYRKKYIGNIFQDFNLINSYTVYQNIEIVMLLAGKKKSECRDIVEQLIKKVGLFEFRNTKASKLSGGQKQRVAIARALAKNAPIIVADEPTGNLDSASAASVMETLAAVSKDKLVVIVTHNFEQAEPYMTRKLTMHDGKIIEDKVVSKRKNDEAPSVDLLYEDLKKAAGLQDKNESYGEEATGEDRQSSTGILTDKMRKTSEIRLGVRNTFNLPAKFILLFIVYFFVSTAVLGQYATTKNSMHESDLMGSNPYFVNTSAERIIVKKSDGTTFNDSDFASIQTVSNVNSIIKNDMAIDAGASINLGDCYAEGPVVSFNASDQENVTFGRMPEDEYEIVIKLDATTDAFIAVSNNGDAYIDMPVVLTDMNQRHVYELSDRLTVSGIILDYDIDDNSSYSLYGYSTIYVSETVANELLISMMADASSTELNFGGTKVKNDYERAIFTSPNVPEGKAYLFEDQLYYYNDEDAVGKDFGLKIKNKYFENKGDYKVGKIITKDNCEKLVGIPKDDYDKYYNCVFISNKDFKELFDKGFYQISVFMDNEQESDVTIQELNDKGFTTLAIKDSLVDSNGNLSELLDLITYARLAIEFVILFLIAYAVIRLIMRSRNSYYSTLRMLGATKSNTGNILKVELVLMMLIAYGVDLLFAVSVNNGVIQRLTGAEMKEATKLLYYLTPYDYTILGIVLLIMSLLIASRYSNRIFAQSAMNSFREGA